MLYLDLPNTDELTDLAMQRADSAWTLYGWPGGGPLWGGDEIAQRVLRSGGRVLSVRQADIPEGKPLAAILRYPV